MADPQVSSVALPDVVEIDMDNLTLGDIEVAEDVLGEPIVGSLSNPSAKVLMALAAMSLRKQGVEAGMADARNIKVSTIRQPEAPAALDPTAGGEPAS